MMMRFAPSWMKERKAPHGKPCTSCGLCCHVALCDVAGAIYDKPPNAPGPCPALLWVDGRSYCGMLTDPTRFSQRAYALGHDVAVRAAAILLFPGEGCDMSMEGDVDQDYRAIAYAQRISRIAAIRWASRVLGLRPWAKKYGAELL